MAVVGTFATELKTCVMKLRRIGDAEGETIEIQHRATVPALGEVIEVSVGEATVRARVTHVSAPAANVQGEFTIDADELSSGYLWETLIALAKSDDGGLPPNAPALQKPKSPHLALEATLKLARQCHALARQALERPKPDLFAARRYVKLARRAGWLAFPYLENEELRRRVIGYKPMSEEEWPQLWPRFGTKAVNE
jgi:hypothetical protein